MKKTKNFDFKIYEIEQKAKTFLLILVVFIFGFLLGCWCKNEEYENKINRQAIEILDLKDQLERERFDKALKEAKDE